MVGVFTQAGPNAALRPSLAAGSLQVGEAQTVIISGGVGPGAFAVQPAGKFARPAHIRPSAAGVVAFPGGDPLVAVAVQRKAVSRAGTGLVSIDRPEARALLPKSVAGHSGRADYGVRAGAAN